MGVYLIGEVIKRTREALGLTQEELCDGICSVDALSKIENGKRSPNRGNFEALMERMGKDGKKYFPYIRSGDMEVHRMRKEIEVLLSNNQYEKAEELLEVMESRIDTEDMVNKQVVLRLRAILEYWFKRIGEKEKREMLVEAFLCTVPKYEEGILPKGMFNRMEIVIFCNIATSYAQEGELDKAINMLRQVDEYLDSISLDTKEKSLIKEFVYANLSKVIGLKGENIESKSIGEKAADLCIEIEKGGNLSGILYQIGYNMELLNAPIEECKEKMRQAYYVAELYGNSYMMNHIIKHVTEIYNANVIATLN